MKSVTASAKLTTIKIDKQRVTLEMFQQIRYIPNMYDLENATVCGWVNYFFDDCQPEWDNYHPGIPATRRGEKHFIVEKDGQLFRWCGQLEVSGWDYESQRAQTAAQQKELKRDIASLQTDLARRREAGADHFDSYDVDQAKLEECEALLPPLLPSLFFLEEDARDAQRWDAMVERIHERYEAAPQIYIAI
jgi:hypothetical protein